jgi:hypothetical protein
MDLISESDQHTRKRRKAVDGGAASTLKEFLGDTFTLRIAARKMTLKMLMETWVLCVETSEIIQHSGMCD